MTTAAEKRVAALAAQLAKAEAAGTPEALASVAAAQRAALEAKLAADAAAVAATIARLRGELAAAEARLAEEVDLASSVLAPLLPELVERIFLAVPLDDRLRGREVCRGWRAFLGRPRLWEVLDFSRLARRTPALLAAAAARAQGALRVLDLTGWHQLFRMPNQRNATLERVLPVLRSNARSLLELRAGCLQGVNDRWFSTALVEELLAAATQLRVLECDVNLDSDKETRGPVPRLLVEPQFGAVRLCSFKLGGRDALIDVPAVVARLALHASLTRLDLHHVQLVSQPALNAVVDFAISQLQSLLLTYCGLGPASLPALTRLLERGSGSAGGSLTELVIYNGAAPLLEGAGVPAFCAALRASRLVKLTLSQMRLFDSLEDGLAVVAACTGHPTLRELNLSRNYVDAVALPAIGAELAALVAANSELQSLDVSFCDLGDNAVRPLFAAVAGSTRLRMLDFSDNDISVECAREAVLPTIKANTSLRKLDFGYAHHYIPELQQAEALVRARAADADA